MTDTTKTATPVLTFRERPARADYSAIVKNALNTLHDAGSFVLVGTMDDATFAAFSAQFASDDGTTIIRENHAPTAMRGAIERTAKSLKRKAKFAPLELHDGDAWKIVGYKVSEITK